MSAYSDKVLADGATLYLRLDETSGTTVTSKVGGYTGTISGGVTLNQPGALADGDKAMAFDGTGTITAPAIAAVNNTTSLSAEIWVRLNTLVATRVAMQLGAGAANSNVQANTAANNWRWELFIGGTVAVTAAGLDTSWHHLVITYDGANVRLYRDGVLSATTPATGVTTITGSLLIGNFSSAGFEWIGSIDDVAIYPTALTPAQISAHFAASKVAPGPPIFSDLRYRWCRYVPARRPALRRSR